MTEEDIGYYVQKYVKRSRNSLSFAENGIIYFGTYKLNTDNAIKFLSLYCNFYSDWNFKDYTNEYIRSVWVRSYNYMGAKKFEESEYLFVESEFYDKFRLSIINGLDLNAIGDRALKECFFSWSILSGVTTAMNEFIRVLIQNDVANRHHISIKELFDLIYDERIKSNKSLEYEKMDLSNLVSDEIITNEVKKEGDENAE